MMLASCIADDSTSSRLVAISRRSDTLSHQSIRNSDQRRRHAHVHDSRQDASCRTNLTELYKAFLVDKKMQRNEAERYGDQHEDPAVQQSNSGKSKYATAVTPGSTPSLQFEKWHPPSPILHMPVATTCDELCLLVAIDYAPAARRSASHQCYQQPPCIQPYLGRWDETKRWIFA